VALSERFGPARSPVGMTCPWSLPNWPRFFPVVLSLPDAERARPQSRVRPLPRVVAILPTSGSVRLGVCCVWRSQERFARPRA